MAPRTGRYFNLDPTPDNFNRLWNMIHQLQDAVDAHTTQLSGHGDTLATLTTGLAVTKTQAQKALLATTLPTSTPSGSSGGTPTTPPPSSDTHPHHLDLITEAKNELVSLGEDLSGPCGAFKIVQKAMPWIQASDPTAGFLSKPDGNNCNAFAVDVVCYTDGVIYDVLGDAGGTNNPQWNFGGTVDPSRYRPSA